MPGAKTFPRGGITEKIGRYNDKPPKQQVYGNLQIFAWIKFFDSHCKPKSKR